MEEEFADGVGAEGTGGEGGGPCGGGWGVELDPFREERGERFEPGVALKGAEDFLDGVLDGGAAGLDGGGFRVRGSGLGGDGLGGGGGAGG
jgi:hypothetical protein